MIVLVHRHCRERARVCSSIIACLAEQEEVCECMESLKKSFGIGQQCGYTNANAKRRAKVKKKESDEGEATQEAEQRVDWLLTLYVEAQRRQCNQQVALSKDLRVSTGIAMTDWGGKHRASVCWRTRVS